MILYKTITFGDGQKVEFGVPNTDVEIKKMFELRFKVYVKEKKFIKTIADIIHLLVPTLKIFYYNFLIQKENRNLSYSFIKPNEQRELLQSAGFSSISENRFVYAGQAILNFAEKISN